VPKKSKKKVAFDEETNLQLSFQFLVELFPFRKIHPFDYATSSHRHEFEAAVVFQFLCPSMLWPAQPSVVATHLHRFACIDVVPASVCVPSEKNIKKQMVFGFSISNHKVSKVVHRVFDQQGKV
jgi:hypothetical protein